MKACVATLTLLVVTFLAPAARAGQYYPPAVADAMESYMRGRRAAVEAVGSTPATSGGRDLQAAAGELAKAIQTRRQDDPQGSVFDQATAAVIRTRLSSLFLLKGPEFAHLFLNPPDVAVAVNARYPEQQPPSSLPPALLAALPALPPELEYRFAGRDLVLLDRATSVVIDVVRNAVPIG